MLVFPIIFHYTMKINNLNSREIQEGNFEVNFSFDQKVFVCKWLNNL